MAGVSTTGSISLGVALVAGRNRVPRPAAGITALVTALLLTSLPDLRRTRARAHDPKHAVSASRNDDDLL